MKWNDIFSAGTVINLNVSMWGARARITARDLGIADSPEVRSALALGSHRLAPQEAFAPITAAATAARRALDSHSVPFGFIKGAGARFVPDKNITACLEKLRNAREAFNNAVNSFCEQYESMKAQQVPVLREALRRAAHSEDAANDAMTRLEAEYPSVDVVRAQFAMGWVPYAVAPPRGAAAAEALAAEGDNVRSVVADMIQDTRAQLSDRVQELNTLMAKGGKLPVRSIEPTRALLDKLADLNITGDRVLEAQITALKAWLSRAESGAAVPSATLEEVRTALEGSIAEAVQEAEEALTSIGKRKFAVMSGGE